MSDSKPPEKGMLGTSSQFLREKSAAVAKMARQTSGEVGGLAKQAAERLSETGGQAWGTLRDRSLDTTESWLQASKTWTTSLLPEARVQAILLPTGGGAADFHCILDFKETVEKLAGGAFTRPCLELWAARADVHRPALAKHLKQEFTSQLKAERDNLRRAAEETALPQLRSLDAEKNKSGTLVEAATFGFTASLLLLFTVANPIFDLIFLMMAVFSGAGGLTKALRYIQVALRIRDNEKSLGKQQEKLESELDAKNKEFLGAIENLDIKIHPVLERVLANMRDLDGQARPLSDEAQEESASPLVDKALKAPRYRQAVPDLYHPLIDAEIS